MVMRNAPTPVPATPAVGLKASRKINSNAGITAPKLSPMIRRAPNTYRAAMAGARIAVTLPMRLMPPRITAATTVDVIRPVAQAGTPNVVRIVSATVFAWMAFPVRKAVSPRRMANATAIHFHLGPSPFSM